MHLLKRTKGLLVVLVAASNVFLLYLNQRLMGHDVPIVTAAFGDWRGCNGSLSQRKYRPPPSRCPLWQQARPPRLCHSCGGGNPDT